MPNYQITSRHWLVPGDEASLQLLRREYAGQRSIPCFACQTITNSTETPLAAFNTRAGETIFFCQECVPESSHRRISMCTHCGGLQGRHVCSCGERATSIHICNTCLDNVRGWYLNSPLEFHYRPKSAKYKAFFNADLRHTRFVGYEVECYLPTGARQPRTALREWYELCRKWGVSVVSDGSLRSPDGYESIEVRLSPAQGAAWSDQLYSFMDFMRARNVQVNSLAGGHVHVDAEGATGATFLNFLLTYGVLEPVLFSIWPDRIGNMYCIPYGEAIIQAAGVPFFEHDILKEGIQRNPKLLRQIFLYSLTGTRHTKPNNGRTYDSQDRDRARKLALVSRLRPPRYSAINFHALSAHSTVEIRLAGATTDADKMYRWARLCSGLMQYAMKANFFKDVLPAVSERYAAETRKAVFKKVCLHESDWEYWERQVNWNGLIPNNQLGTLCSVSNLLADQGGSVRSTLAAL